MSSILFLFCLPLLSRAQSVVSVTATDGYVYPSTVYDNTGTSTSSVTSYSASSYSTTGPTTGGEAYSPTPTAFQSSTSTSQIVLPTVPFTGQALLVGTCAIPQFTVLTFPDGGSIEIPLIGCSDQRPECCPSLNLSAAPSESSTTPTISSWTASTPSPLPTGVISMLSQHPLTVCPNDMVDLDPVCCPSGFSHYGQSIVGNLPCVSILSTTVISPPPSVLASISSAIAASLLSASTTAAPTVSVIINQIFALGLPCADNAAEHHGLSTAAKAGIGAGVGVGALFIILGIWACLAVRHRRRAKMKKLEARASGAPVSQPAGHPVDPKYTSVSSMPTPTLRHTGTFPPHMPPYGMPGHGQPEGYGPVFGYAQPQDMYGPGFGIQAMPALPSPPPFYGFGLPREESNPAEVDATTSAVDSHGERGRSEAAAELGAYEQQRNVNNE